MGSDKSRKSSGLGALFKPSVQVCSEYISKLEIECGTRQKRNLLQLVDVVCGRTWVAKSDDDRISPQNDNMGLRDHITVEE